MARLRAWHGRQDTGVKVAIWSLIITTLITSLALLRDVVDFKIGPDAESPPVTAASHSAELVSPTPPFSPLPAPSTTSAPTALPNQASIKVDPANGRPGDGITVSGSGFQSGEDVRIEFFEGGKMGYFEGPYGRGDYPADAAGQLPPVEVTIPEELCCAGQEFRVVVTGRASHDSDEVRFRLR